MFRGVCFVLIGFDSLSEAQYRSELLNGGGVDVGRYDASCTHVIVHDRIYDDPICVAARNDGKTLVTDLWVEDSLDLGSPADANRILYRPLKDLKGIPGSESLYICLTGYQKQDRDDIMKMVGLMGAQFSKPLVASKVTHLICYKFEGEKYELARRIKIKLVNHQWLEDCLKTWEILPEDKYNKSGWELEIMSTEARDSEEETEPRTGICSSLNNGMLIHSSELPTPVREAPKIQYNTSASGMLVHGSGLSTPVREAPKNLLNASTGGMLSHGSELPTPMREAQQFQQNASTTGMLAHSSELSTPVREPGKIHQNTSASTGPLNVTEDIHINNLPASTLSKYTHSNNSPDLYGLSNRKVSADSTPGKETSSSKGADLYGVNSVDVEGFGCQDVDAQVLTGSGRIMLEGGIGKGISNPDDVAINFNKEGNAPFPDRGTSKRSPHSDPSVEKPGVQRFLSRKTTKQLAASLSPKLSSHQQSSPKRYLEENTVGGALTSEQAGNNLSSSAIQIPTVCTEMHYKEGSHKTFPRKRKLAISKSGLLKGGDQSVMKNPQTTTTSTDTEHISVTIDEPLPKMNPNLMNNTSPSEVVSAVNCAANQHADSSITKSSALQKKPFKRGWPVLATKNSDNFDSSSDCIVKEFPVVVKPNHKFNKHMSVSDATDYLGAMAINNKSAVETNKLEPMAVDGRSAVEAINEVKGPETSSRGLSVSNKPDIVTSKLPNLPATGIDDPLNSPNSKKSETEQGRLNAPSSTLAESKDIESSSKPSKKLLVKKTVGYKRKSGMSLTSKGNNASYPDKTAMPDYMKCKDVAEPEMLSDEANIEACKGPDVIMAEVEGMEQTASIPKIKTVAVNAKEALLDAEKENKPSENGAQSVNSGKQGRQKASVKKSNKLLMEGNEKVVGTGSDGLQAGGDLRTGSSEISTCKGSDVIMEEEVEGVPQTVNKSKNKAVVLNAKETLVDEEKENKQSENGFQNASSSKKGRQKAAVRKSNQFSRQNNQKVVVTDTGSLQAGGVESIPRSENKSKIKAIAFDAKEALLDVEKENMLTENGAQSVNSSRKGKQNGDVKKPNELSIQNDEKVIESDANGEQVGGCLRNGSSEPAWFILSGHRLQRKEFQQVVRRLRGRLCRDSHNWSYQATHFILPDPVRRTEKFFAAASAGRWILKTDYLAASNRVGRFLAEEPFEWYKSSLSEDGAINLEAPRKWRLLRERTGHGALYGMRIVIYGECITPPLDTLKRAVKAGDGTILATSPPYTRFLKSGIDFAVISPGMPRVDCWIQEFIRHEIPCVAADYLVEYVCKPGYSLERHVLYKTHAWADKSFANLSGRLEEIVEISMPSENDNDDIACDVCGSRDRGEVMLICGDEGGTLGCGVGTHIDCCDPPLELVPQGDWFCLKCRKSESAKPMKGKRKGSSLKCK